MLNSEETKPVAIAVIELRLSEGIVNCPTGSSSLLTTAVCGGGLVNVLCPRSSSFG